MKGRSSIIALAVASALGASAALTYAHMDEVAGQEPNELVNVTLTEPLVIDLGAGNLITLPTGTTIGKQEIEARNNAAGVPVKAETELKNVTLTADLTFTDPSTGQLVTLPTGTMVQRLTFEQRFDATGATLLRSEFRLRALEPDGTVVNLRNETGTPMASGNSGRGGSSGGGGRDENELRNVTLTAPLVIDLGAGNLITLPTGTTIGKQEIEARNNAAGVPVKAETELRNVTLTADLTFTDPSTGQLVTLPTGTTIQRLSFEQRFDATGATALRSEFRLRALEPDGTVVNLRNETGTPMASASSGRGSGGRDGSSRSSGGGGRDENELRNVTLTAPLVIDLGAGNLITLPTGTTIGKQEIEARNNAAGVPVKAETELKNVTLTADLSFTDPSTGQLVTLPTGTTIQRLSFEQRFDATGATVLRSEFALRALEPDGTVVRLKNETGAAAMADAMRGGAQASAAISSSGRGVGGGGDRAAGDSRDGGRTAVADRSQGGDRGGSDRGGGGGDRGGGDRGSAAERPAAVSRPVAVERPTAVERPAASAERVARVERVATAERPQRVEHADRVDRVDHSGRH